MESNTIPNAPCPRCQSRQTKVVAASGPHAAALKCSDCDRWLKWLSKKELQKINNKKPAVLTTSRPTGLEIPRDRITTNDREENK